MKTDLKELRDMAFDITIDPNNSIHSASADDVVKVLNAYISSYKNFIAVKLKAEEKSPEEISKAVTEAKLLVVNTEFNSYHNSLAPSDYSNFSYFESYKDDVLDTDVDNYGQLQELIHKYNKEELYAIFNPIFSATSKDYSLKVKTDAGERKVKKPTQSFAIYFKPSKKKEVKEDSDKIFQIYVQSKDLKTISKKDIIYSAELEHKTYPYSIDRITTQDKLIFLNDTIHCNVEFKDDLYFIGFDDLNINVWGETRKEAEEAFDFTFYSLVINYVEEDDKLLSHDAIVLKNTLITMIRTIK